MDLGSPVLPDLSPTFWVGRFGSKIDRKQIGYQAVLTSLADLVEPLHQIPFECYTKRSGVWMH